MGSKSKGGPHDSFIRKREAGKRKNKRKRRAVIAKQSRKANRGN